MGPWPTQDDEKRLLFSNRSSWKCRPPLCHPEQLVCLRQVEGGMNDAKVDCGECKCHKPIVIPTGAKRSGGTCGSLDGHPTRPDAPLFIRSSLTSVRQVAREMNIHRQSLAQPHQMRALPFPLSSRANPDFLPRSTGQGSVCAFQ
jgi:hypothetical protein